MELPKPRRNQQGRQEISDSVLELGAKTVEGGWQTAVAEQLATVLNEELWEEIRKKRGNRQFCESLAATAKGLDRVADAPKNVAGWVAGKLSRWLKWSTLEQKIARKIAEQVTDKVVSAALWPKVKLQLTARFLRICGVWTCVDGGLDLRGCECFKDLAEKVTKDYMKGLLEAKLNQIV